MIFEWIYQEEQATQLKNFLRSKGISKSLLATIKFRGGAIWLNDEVRNVRALVEKGDNVRIRIPDEAEHETTTPSAVPIDILYEDEHFLIVNKPAGVASIPSREHPHLSMANRVKGYYLDRQYPDLVIHTVTRLDRDTTGAMLFAKHAYAHALMDQLLRKKEVEKTYLAILSGNHGIEDPHGFIDAPIGREPDSIMTRRVSEDGKPALTEYWLEESYEDGQMVRIKLHTGRTHQIRVHFTHLGAPLLGDDLYGGQPSPLITRQALHCRQLTFIHPITGERVEITAPLPEDFREWRKAHH